MLRDAINSAQRRVPTALIYVIGTGPLLWLVWLIATDGLGADPVKALEHGLGLWGLKFVVAGLCVSPLRRFAGINLLRFRRALGLLAFFYVMLHLIVWLVLDMGMLWAQIFQDIVKRPYITLGMIAFILMLPLGLTSNNAAVRKIGAARWRKLHRLTYPVAILAATHFVMVGKVWTVQALAYLGAVLVLLVLRVNLRSVIPAIRMRFPRNTDVLQAKTGRD